ncbi:MAG: thiamine-phosphate kinase [Bacteroidales bacterium]|jgi:thiamine-monophosphate kinase|nr:thiamine-phosphate kinase [Bacteroidales bacterium]
MNDHGEKTSIGEFGKYGLIHHLTKNFRPSLKSTLLGIGDDAAVIDSRNCQTLVSTDMFLEGIHFSLVYTPLKHLGYKAVVRAISDIYAMNGTPEQLLVSTGISSRFAVEDIELIYEGIGAACERYRIDLAGGDTTSSVTGLAISLTAIGRADKGSIIKRNGARPNDLICVTGDFGAAYMGLQLLERERRLFEKSTGIQPDLAGYEYVIGRQLKPDFPAGTLLELENSKIVPTSMIDVTEGLASDLIQICKQSQTGCRIYYSKIPVDYETSRVAEEFNIDPVTPALNGGEDYELLFTAPLEDIDKINSLHSVKVIGYITEQPEDYFIAGDDGSEVRLSAQGWTGKAAT